MAGSITVEQVRASKWDGACLDFRGGWQRRYRCRGCRDLELVVTGTYGKPTVKRYHVYGVEIGSTIEEAVAALNDWSIVQAVLDAECAQNNVDAGDLHGRSLRMSKPRHDEQMAAAQRRVVQLGFGF